MTREMLPDEATERRRAAITAIAVALGEDAADVEINADLTVPPDQWVILLRGERLRGEREERAIDALKIFISRSVFEGDALVVLSDRAHARTTARTFAALYEHLVTKTRIGACHMASAVAFVLLKEQSVNAALCIGKVAVADELGDLAVFDHSWIEIDNEVYDVAIETPEDTSGIARAPVMATRHIDNGRPADLVYGVNFPAGFDAAASAVLSTTLGEYMDNFPDHEQGLWGVAVDIGTTIGIATSAASLRNRYADVRWILRAPSVSPDDARRERNRRKRERRGRR